MALTTGDVVKALRLHHAPDRGWATVAEVTVAAGYFNSTHMPEELRLATGQRIDFFALGTWGSTGYERVAYEIKVSRSDLLRELKDPTKRQAAELLANRFLFATPSGLMKRGEVPEGCGLVEVRANGSVYTFRKGEYRERPPMPVPFVASLVRTAADQRSMDNRCGARRCRRTAKHWRWVDGERHGWGDTIPLCSVHAEAWDQAAAEAAA